MSKRTCCNALGMTGFVLACAASQAQEPERPGLPAMPSVASPTIVNGPAAPQAPGAPHTPPAPTGPAVSPPAASPAEAALELNDFQQLVLETTGRRLPLFGYALFQEPPSTFAPVENIPVTPDYVIGPGDELVIRAWGQIDVDYRAVVDRNGTINIPQVGVVPVAGLRYQDLTAHLRTALSRNFRNFQLMVTLGQLRSVRVFVVGHARRPGAYTLSSLSTLVNAVFAVGGPSAHGSMRAIQLKRGSQVVTQLDLYDLLLRGDKSRDAPLLAGDVVYFPPVGSLAAVSGAVKNPAVYELKGAAPLSLLLEYAGGLTTTAQTRLATIERIDNRATRLVDNFSLDGQALARPVKDGDLVSVLRISPKIDNAVTLRGKVAMPLRHAYQPGMRVKDLVPDREALVTPDYYLRKNLAVRADSVRQGELAANVRALADEINWDYAVIERQDEATLSTTLIPFNLGKAVLEADAAHNLPLKAGDVVTVFSKTDVAAPAERRPVVVRLEGEFNNAGVYQARPGETLRRLVARIGGVTEKAYLFGAELNRESTRRLQEERLQQALNQLEQDVQRAAFTRAQNVVAPEDAAALRQETEAQRALVARLRTLKPTGRIVLKLPPEATVADLPDLALEDGDRFLVPRAASMVSVFGTVFNESSFLYQPDRTVSDYLAEAGGPRKEADRDSIYVIRADGSVISRTQSGFLVGSLNGHRVMPGDTIVVPEDFQRTTWTKDLKDWTQIFYQFGLGAAALKVIGD